MRPRGEGAPLRLHCRLSTGCVKSLVAAPTSQGGDAGKVERAGDFLSEPRLIAMLCLIAPYLGFGVPRLGLATQTMQRRG